MELAFPASITDFAPGRIPRLGEIVCCFVSVISTGAQLVLHPEMTDYVQVRNHIMLPLQSSVLRLQWKVGGKPGPISAKLDIQLGFRICTVRLANDSNPELVKVHSLMLKAVSLLLLLCAVNVIAAASPGFDIVQPVANQLAGTDNTHQQSHRECVEVMATPARTCADGSLSGNNLERIADQSLLTEHQDTHNLGTHNLGNARQGRGSLRDLSHFNRSNGQDRL